MKTNIKKRTKEIGLLQRLVRQFSLCLAAIFLFATPLFYYLTRRYYAEDMEDLIEAVRAGKDIPKPDLEADIMAGMMIQYVVIFVVLAVAVVVTLRFLVDRLWRPFERTLSEIERFNLAQSEPPQLPQERTREFSRLNEALTRLLQKDKRIYRAQKEFTENASHELQTPLAIVRSRLDLLIQKDFDAETAAAIDELYRLNARMERLNRNLLLLAKIDNGQYEIGQTVQPVGFITGLLPGYRTLYPEVRLETDGDGDLVALRANPILLECLMNNLVVNAIRHTTQSGVPIRIRVAAGRLCVMNPAAEPLRSEDIFNRFSKGADGNRPSKGCGLGLAIVKAIADYHGWRVDYQYAEGQHCFSIHYQ